MSAIVVAGWMRVDPARRGDLVEGHRYVMELARQEPACIDFVVSADPVDDSRVCLLEIWDDRAALEAFRARPFPEGRTAPPEPDEISVREYLADEVRTLAD
ncbi:Quinol monooxygenase YgiN [Kytococcus aerolatus]|uniref:Quinol monooxygenase YgiN n=1 Tax=Kytococcus aerolatus TaxID=592308 RepID=A0A212U6T1_9MICO|nr:antibiotic biosynthesis monooxygenase [Kytococcus aerolatus]SNC73781.1 Quinol monooxygenase YgiN [Kytococcus aerolatus]